MFKRPTPPPLDGPVRFQVKDIHVGAITHQAKPGQRVPKFDTTDFSWLGDDKALAEYLKAIQPFATRRKPSAIFLTGRTIGGESVCCKIQHPRSFLVEVPPGCDTDRLMERVLSMMVKVPTSDISAEVLKKPRSFGWKSSKKNPRAPKIYKLLEIKTVTDDAYYEAVKQFRAQSRQDGGVPVDLHEMMNRFPADLKFSVDTDIGPGTWITIPNAPAAVRVASTSYEINLKSVDQVLDIVNESNDMAPTRSGLWDIEAVPGSKEEIAEYLEKEIDKFPNPTMKTHQTVMIGFTVAQTEPAPFLKRYLFHLAKTKEEIELARAGAEVPRAYQDKQLKEGIEYVTIFFETELAMLLALRDAMVIFDIDGGVAFNGDTFDIPYVLARVRTLIGNDRLTEKCRFMRMGRIVTEVWGKIEVGERGNRSKMWPFVAACERGMSISHSVTGRFGLDLRVFIQMSMTGVTKYKTKDYSLDNLSNKLLGTNKLPMTHTEIFRRWYFGTQEELDYLGHYCVQDVELMNRILISEDFYGYLGAMATLTHTSIDKVINSGQSVKAHAQYAALAKKQGRFVNNLYYEQYKYKGACVLEPTVGVHGMADKDKDEPNGAYINLNDLDEDVRDIVKRLPKELRQLYDSDENVFVCDFASLYPSVMMEDNMCLTTIRLPGRLGDSAVEKALCGRGGNNADPPDLPGLDVRPIEIYDEEEHRDDPAIAPTNVHYFVQNPIEPYEQGVVPLLLSTMKKMRKVYKKLMKTDKGNWALHNARQMAIKISMNSFYGVMAMWCCAVAEAVTSQGRRALMITADEARKDGFEVIYGDTDSVMIKFREPDLAKAFARVAAFATRVTKEVLGGGRNIHVLELEKVCKPYSLLGKKFYLSYMLEEIGGEWEIDYKGLATKRRDKPAVLTNLMWLMTKIVIQCRQMSRQAVGEAFMIALEEHCEAMLSRSLPVDDFKICQRIGKLNSKKENAAHMTMARIIEERTGATFGPGDAVWYVHVVDPTKRLASDRVETPKVVGSSAKNMKKIDVKLYLEKKVKDSVVKFVKPFVAEETVKRLFAVYIREMEMQAQGDHMAKFFSISDEKRREDRKRKVRAGATAAAAASAPPKRTRKGVKTRSLLDMIAKQKK